MGSHICSLAMFPQPRCSSHILSILSLGLWLAGVLQLRLLTVLHQLLRPGTNTSVEYIFEIGLVRTLSFRTSSLGWFSSSNFGFCVVSAFLREGLFLVSTPWPTCGKVLWGLSFSLILTILLCKSRTKMSQPTDISFRFF